MVTSRNNSDCTKSASSSNTIVDYAYDADGRMTSLTDWNGKTTNLSYQTPSTYQATPALAKITYPASTGETINFTYHTTGFLSQEAYAGPATGSTSTTWTPNGDDLIGSIGSQPVTYNVKNQLTSGDGDSYQYNGDGAITQDTPSGQQPERLTSTPKTS